MFVVFYPQPEDSTSCSILDLKAQKFSKLSDVMPLVSKEAHGVLPRRRSAEEVVVVDAEVLAHAVRPGVDHAGPAAHRAAAPAAIDAQDGENFYRFND